MWKIIFLSLMFLGFVSVEGRHKTETEYHRGQAYSAALACYWRLPYDTTWADKRPNADCYIPCLCSDQRLSVGTEIILPDDQEFAGKIFLVIGALPEWIQRQGLVLHLVSQRETSLLKTLDFGLDRKPNGTAQVHRYKIVIRRLGDEASVANK